MGLSVCFLTRNEEANIARALRSLIGVAEEGLLVRTAVRTHPTFPADLVTTIKKERKQVLPCNVTLRSYAGLAEQTEPKLRWILRLLELELRDRPGQLHYLIEYGRTLLHVADPKGHEVLAEAVEQIMPARDAPRAPAMKVQVLLEYLMAVPADLSKRRLSKEEALEV